MIVNYRTCATGCLIGADNGLLNLKPLVDWPQGHQSNSGSAIGVGNKLLSLPSRNVNFRDDQRNAVGISESR